jgi:DNA-binding MarR family transcriptional regulator
MSDRRAQEWEAALTPGALVHIALTRVLRWSARRENRRLLFGQAGEGLSQNDVWLLDAVDSNGPVRLSDLASWQGVDKSTITPQVRRLEARGLLERRSGASDRRVVLLGITRHGRSVQQRRATAGAALIDTLLHAWPAEDRTAFATLFARFADQLDTQAHLQPGRPDSRPGSGKD